MDSGGGPEGSLYVIIDAVEKSEKEKRKPPRILSTVELRSLGAQRRFRCDFAYFHSPRRGTVCRWG